MGALFFDAGEICELRLHTVTCLASYYVGKQRAAKKCAMAMNKALVSIYAYNFTCFKQLYSRYTFYVFTTIFIKSL